MNVGKFNINKNKSKKKIQDNIHDKPKEKNNVLSNYHPGQTSIVTLLKVRPLQMNERLKNPEFTMDILDRETVIFRHENFKDI